MRAPFALLCLTGCLLLGGCQEITPPVRHRLTGIDQSQEEAKAWALQRIRLGDLHLQAGYYDLAYENYWVAYRRWSQDFTQGSTADFDLLLRSLRLPVTQAINAPGLPHSTIARITLALELQQKYRLLAANFEHFAGEDQAGTRENAVHYLIAAGYYYHLGGLPHYALPPLKRAIAIDPSSLEALQNLAEVSAALEDYTAAISYWRMIRVISNRFDAGHPQEGAIRAYYQEESARKLEDLEARLAAQQPSRRR